MASGMIVLAEDDPKLRKLYVDFLEINGFKVAAARDGVEALKLLHGITPTVLVLDVMMPNMDGIETCRRARKILGGDVPIMFLTASDQLDRVQECMRAGGDDYMMKTETLDHILERVRHWTKTSARQELVTRRTQAKKEVEVAVETRHKEWEQGADLSSETDDTVRKMSEFIAQARSRAPDGFGTTVEQKLFLLGYATGVVKHWSAFEKALNRRFMGYLRSVLAETNLLSTKEIAQMIDTFDELASNKKYKTALAQGRQDCLEAAKKGHDFVPTGFANIEAPAST